MRMRVGSSSPATFGSAAPLTFGSSLSATTVPLASNCDWFSTYGAVRDDRRQRDLELDQPCRRTPASVRLRTSSRPVPFAPPVAVVLLGIGAGRHRHQRQRARHERCVGVQAIDLVAQREPAEREVRQVLDAQAVAQPVAGTRLGGGFAPLVTLATVFSNVSASARSSRASDPRRRRQSGSAGPLTLGSSRERTGRAVGEPQRRLVRDHGADRHGRRQRDVELDQDLRRPAERSGCGCR